MEEQQEMSIRGIEEWLNTPQGRYVLSWEKEKISAVVDDLFGYNALQIGLPQHELLAGNRIPFRQKIGESFPVDVLCNFTELPFAANSIDLVVMPHALEFNDDAHQILREVERILIPEGQLVITGFNPISLWGLRRRLPGHQHAFPFNGNFLSVPRLKDWLKLLNFEVDRGNFGCYAPPCQQTHWVERWRFMDVVGDRWWSYAGGVYLLRAVKRLRGMRLVFPNWNVKKSRTEVLRPVVHKENKGNEPLSS